MTDAAGSIQPWLADSDVVLYHGDALDVLRDMPDGSVDCVVTSPPYWGLRDYGTGEWEGGDPDHEHETIAARNGRGGSGAPGKQTAGAFPSKFAKEYCECGARHLDRQLGLETTPDLFVANMVAVFREVRRVLADHGTCWVNLGDSYAGSGPSGASYQSETTKRRAEGDGTDGNFRVSKRLAERGLTYADKKPVPPPGLKPKDLVGIPWRVAFALQADGWYLRSDIVWAKPNPMPESVTDRPTKSHEYVFLLTKSHRYFFDQEAVREPHESTRWGGPVAQNTEDWKYRNGGELVGTRERDGREFYPNGGRNIRSVWTIATQPYPEAHFATFPEELARRCIVAGCPERVCGVCGKPSERIVESGADMDARYARGEPTRHGLNGASASSASNVGGFSRPAETLGWSDCGHNNWRPGTVLDPFIGSGTTAKIARDHQRYSIGIDLNGQYLELAARRLQQLSLLAT